MSNKRISQLLLELNPKVSDLIALASDGLSKRTTLGSVFNSSFPATFGNTTINGDLDVNGNLRVSSLVSASILYESGSTIFGNTSDDTHQFTGSVSITGQTEFGGDLVPKTPQGATLGTIDKPFRELYLQSGSISIESDTPGDPSAIISNRDGNLEISVGGVLLVEDASSFTAPTGSFDYLSVSGSVRMTGSLDISGSIQYPEWIDFKMDNNVVGQQGRMWWDVDDTTLNLGINSDVTLQMGQELHYPKVVNKDSVDIVNGTLLMIRVSDITQGQRLAVVRWDGTKGYPADYIVGVATSDIARNAEGFATWFGYVRDISITELQSAGVKDPTETWQEGQILYPHPTLLGGFTNQTPTSPNVKSTIAVTTALTGNNLTILVRPKLGQRFEELYNVDFTSAVTGSIVYKAGSQWGTTEQSIKVIPPHLILTEVSESLNFANDTAAAAGGVPLGGLYRNGNVIQIRLV